MPRAAEAVYLWLFVTRSWPPPLLRPTPPFLSLLVPVLLLLLAMARLAALMWVPSGLTRLCLPPAVVEAAALATSPVVGWSSSVRLVVGWPPCVVASLLLVVVCLMVRLEALGAWRPATCFVAPLPPVAGETPALALSPVGMLWPVRLWGSSPSAASTVMMAVAPATGCWGGRCRGPTGTGPIDGAHGNGGPRRARPLEPE